jgi:hypothetical protein
VPFLGIPVFSDTTITQHLLTTDGCDSIIHWNVSVKSSATHTSSAIENGIQITPNPSSGQTCITVNASDSNILLVKVHAATGALLQTITGNIHQQKQQMCLDLAPFANGIYFITVQSDTRQSIHRFIKSGT